MSDDNDNEEQIDDYADERLATRESYKQSIALHDAEQAYERMIMRRRGYN